MTTLATRDYLAKLYGLDKASKGKFTPEYDATSKNVPAHLTVARAKLIKKRTYPSHEQELHDWIVCYRDGTADAISLGPLQETPRSQKFFSRIAAMTGGDFVVWEPTDEEMRSC